MKKLAFVLVPLLASAAAGAQTPKYPPLSEFMMPQEAEIALARSAAPDNVSSRASIKIFTTSGFKVAVEGDNGFVCTVLRGWAAPTYGPVQYRDYVYVADLRALGMSRLFVEHCEAVAAKINITRRWLGEQ
jgi:hypothetical protein